MRKSLIFLFVFLPMALLAGNPEKSSVLSSQQAGFSLQTLDSQTSSNGGVFFLKSLLVPGWGQKSLGGHKSSRGFFFAEIATISAAFGFTKYRSWLEDDFESYAAQHAQVTIARQDDAYWVDIGEYISIYDYNESILRQRNLKFLRNPEGVEYWQWDSLDNALTYRDMRVQAGNMKTYTQFAIAGIVTNHIVSALHALWLKRKIDREESSAKILGVTDFHVAFQPLHFSKGGIFNLSFSL